MPRISGVGSWLLVGAHDLSGDARAINGLQQSYAPIDVTGLRERAAQRILARSDASIDWTSHYENADIDSRGAHIFRDPATWRDEQVSLILGGAVGSHVANMRAKTVTYAPTIADDGALTATINAQASDPTGGWPALRWGRALAVGESRPNVTLTQAQATAITPTIDLGAPTPDVTVIELLVHVTRLERTDGGSPDVAIQWYHSADGSTWTQPLTGSVYTLQAGGVGTDTVQPYAGAGITLNRYARLQYVGNFHSLEFTAAMFWQT